MSLLVKSQELKEFVSSYDTQWFLGELSNQMHSIGHGNTELKDLSSPQRQLYFLAGLMLTSPESQEKDMRFTHEKWEKIVVMLNEIEHEYDKLFFPKNNESIDEKWIKIRQVAMPSFLSYFNQGPLNFEEQVINWASDLFTQLDSIIESKTGLKTEDFIRFYNNLDALSHRKFQGFVSPKQKHLFKPGWLNLSRIGHKIPDEVPDFIREIMEPDKPLFTFMSDPGIIKRFYPTDLVSEMLPIEKIMQILEVLSCERKASDYTYYTSTNPGNPLYEKPIVNIGKGMYQVFEVKQVMHAIEYHLEGVCTSTKEGIEKYNSRKGQLLENRVLELFKKFFKTDYKFHQGYYVDGKEQDILFLWKDYAFIIETKGYNLREPLRNPDQAFNRIKDDFNTSIGKGYVQTKRIEEKFKAQQPLRIEDAKGHLIEEIDTTQYEDQDFSIIVNLKSFGQIQNDLATLLEITQEDVYPWAVKLDDLEVFILTLIAQKKKPEFLIDYLLIREELHGRLICGDESEIMGGYLTGKIDKRIIESNAVLKTNPDMIDIFDQQYNKGMGFENEKLLKEKESGRYIFW